MNLAAFPMDKQRCPLKFGSCKYYMFQLMNARMCCLIYDLCKSKVNQLSFVLKTKNFKYYPVFYVPVGYTKDDVSYQWTTGRGVNIASDMKLSQFDLISTPTGNETTNINKGSCYNQGSYYLN